MRCFYYNSYTPWLELPVQVLSDTVRHLFLNIQSPREVLRNTCELAQANDIGVRYVTNMRDSDKRQHVMIAQAHEWDLPLDNHLV
jgi:hypothetical protein